MALLGGGVGGAGNPVGGSFTGPAEALEIIGDFAYAYSGLVQVDTSAVTQLEFTTGNFLFVGDLTIFGVSNPDAVDPGATSIAEIFLNGVGVFNVKLSTTEEDMPTTATIPFLIPAYTEVKVDITGDTGSAGYTTGASCVGPIYRD